MKNLKNKKKDGGITLVALVVTIVVLFILSGITIATLFGDNGIISAAQKAAEETKKSQIISEIQLKLLEKDLFNTLNNNGKVTEEDLQDAIGEDGVINKDEEENIVSITKDGITVAIGEIYSDTIANMEYINKYEITYNLAGGINNVENPSTYTEKSEDIILKEPTREGYEFKGWIGSGLDDITKTVTIVKGSTGNKEYTANWRAVYATGTLVSNIIEIEHDTVDAVDAKGNKVVIPGGFKVALGTSVQQGIVIEDKDGNQFVWIPVSNINHNGSNKIKLDDNSEIEITLGRYNFDFKGGSSGEPRTGTGNATAVQYGVNYAAETMLNTYGTHKDCEFYELKTFRESNQNIKGTNATAKDLAGFIQSVNTNKGYYIARYEASYASGSTFGVGNNETYYKPASKISISFSREAWTPSSETKGQLWNFITQGNASKASRQMYYGDSYVESDLANSYARDTAVVYIQAMDGNGSYALVNDINGTLSNTGTRGDEKYGINDMAKNIMEWTTEYSTRSTNERYWSCNRVGGYYGCNYVTTCRQNDDAISSIAHGGFRPILYLKNN